MTDEAIDFGVAKANERVDYRIALNNPCEEAEIPFRIHRAAYFKVSPDSGIIPPGLSKPVFLTYHPKALGMHAFSFVFRSSLGIIYNFRGMKQASTIKQSKSAPWALEILRRSFFPYIFRFTERPTDTKARIGVVALIRYRRNSSESPITSIPNLPNGKLACFSRKVGMTFYASH